MNELNVSLDEDRSLVSLAVLEVFDEIDGLGEAPRD